MKKELSFSSCKEELAASFRACSDITARSRSSFRHAIRILPQRQRQGMEALYAFMRIIDDIADDESQSAATRKERLAAWRDWRTQSAAIIPALVATVDRFQIPEFCLSEAVVGVAQDIEFELIPDWDGLRQYCQRVAGTVGHACVAIWGIKGASESGQKRGAVLSEHVCRWIEQEAYAVQLTNILRDIVEDAQRGRCYVPVCLLEKYGLSVELFLAYALGDAALCKSKGGNSADNSAAVCQVLGELIAEAGQNYEASLPLSDVLLRPGRLSNALIRGVYNKIFQKIQRAPLCVFQGRVRLNKLEKWGFVCRALYATLIGPLVGKKV